MKTKMTLITALLALVLGASTSIFNSNASDHDDGELDLKGRALNLTDLYVFREDSQTGDSQDGGNLILVMNTHGRALAQQQYYYSTKARYQWHINRVAGQDAVPGERGGDIIVRLEYGAPDVTGSQDITVTLIRDGQEYVVTENEGGEKIKTTNFADSAAGSLVNNTFSIDGETFTLFSGPREDPFFFDVDWYFRTRSFAASNPGVPAPPEAFRNQDTAIDFTKGYNVMSNVIRVPISFLQTSMAEEIFDVWETISIPDVSASNFLN